MWKADQYVYIQECVLCWLIHIDSAHQMYTSPAQTKLHECLNIIFCISCLKCGAAPHMSLVFSYTAVWYSNVLHGSNATDGISASFALRMKKRLINGLWSSAWI